MRIFTYVFTIILLIFGITFSILNAKLVPINYYVGSHQFPLSLLLVLTLGIGILFGLIVSFKIYLRLKRECYQLRQRTKLAEKEVENLRTIPIKDEH